MRAPRILIVCTHNRTRSVMIAALLDRHLAARAPGLVPNRLVLDSAGLTTTGEPATERTVRLLGRRGIDVGGHRSRSVTPESVEGATLVVGAEQQHVVSLAGRHPGVFERCFTLPEVVHLGEQAGGWSPGEELDRWVARVARSRKGETPLDYLDLDRSEVGEIDDPTGRSPSSWTTTFEVVDDLTCRLARLLSGGR